MKNNNEKKVIIYGCGDMGIQTYNILKHDKSYEVIGFLDDNSKLKNSQFINYPIFGDYKELKDLKNKYSDIYGIATIGNNIIRNEKTIQMREEGFSIASAIHPDAFIDNISHINILKTFLHKNR